MTPEAMLLNEWRVAARAASTAEKAVSEAFIRYFNNKGEAPTQDQLDDAARRRAVANDLFLLVIGGVGHHSHNPADLN